MPEALPHEQTPNPQHLLASGHPEQATAVLRDRQQRLSWLALLSGLGVALNTLPVPLFYGVHVLLGSLPALIALLLWRTWWAVPMATLAALQTIRLWGHPWAVLIFTAELAWLWLALHRWNGRACNDTDGRVVSYSIVYWLLIGAPLVLLFYGVVMQIDLANVTVVAVKQSFNGVFNTVLAMTAVLMIRWLQSERGMGPGISLRGLIAVVVMMAVFMPTLLLSLIANHQIGLAVENGALDGLKTLSLAIGRAPGSDSSQLLQGLNDQLAFRRIDSDGLVQSSDPALFDRLETDFQDSGRAHVNNKELALLIPRGQKPTLKKWVNGYWSYSHQYEATTVDKTTTSLVQVVQPAGPTVIRMQQQSSYLLGVIFITILLAAWLSLWLGRLVKREFSLAVGPLEAKRNELVPLHLSGVIELRQLAEQINDRSRHANQLSERLRLANGKLHSSRRELQNLLRRDPLTGCGNPKALEERLQEEVERCKRSGEALTCICLDVDSFGAFNKSHGRRAGDALLQGLAKAVLRRLRTTDHLYRPGQDSFVVLAIGCQPQDTFSLADSLRSAMSQVYLVNSETNTKLFSSSCVGVSCFVPGADTADSLLDRAQQALAEARGNGAGQLVVA